MAVRWWSNHRREPNGCRPELSAGESVAANLRTRESTQESRPTWIGLRLTSTDDWTKKNTWQRNKTSHRHCEKRKKIVFILLFYFVKIFFQRNFGRISACDSPSVTKTCCLNEIMFGGMGGGGSSYENVVFNLFCFVKFFRCLNAWQADSFKGMSAVKTKLLTRTSHLFDIRLPSGDCWSLNGFQVRCARVLFNFSDIFWIFSYRHVGWSWTLIFTINGRQRWIERVWSTVVQSFNIIWWRRERMDRLQMRSIKYGGPTASSKIRKLTFSGLYARSQAGHLRPSWLFC